jgi:polyphosphate glucokinase
MTVLGIDIGGSGIKGAPVDPTKGILVDSRKRLPTPQPSKPDRVAEAVARIAAEFQWDGPIGCTFPAVIQHGVVLTAANVHRDWVGVDAEALLSQRTGAAVTVINDADAAGLAACDPDGNGELELADAVYGLNFCFAGTDTRRWRHFRRAGRGRRRT